MLFKADECSLSTMTGEGKQKQGKKGKRKKKDR